jgi:transglutaminase-like putative cysteine protease
MAVVFVKHRTQYRYAQPVTLLEHRLMSRPRDSHDLRLIQTGLTVEPRPREVRWLHDVFGNSIAVTEFDATAHELVFESTFLAEHFPASAESLCLEPYARHLPFRYSAEDSADLGLTKERQYADPERKLDEWAYRFIEAAPSAGTLEVLTSMTRAVKAEFRYRIRHEAGVQSPLETLQLGSGSCRDFAVLMMEAVRSLGLGARFVSGYLYDESLLAAKGRMVGGGATHAWLQVYLPGAGWVEFDPTNALVGGRNLIRVAVARDPAQAPPVTGAFIGNPGDFVTMTATVEVTAA